MDDDLEVVNVIDPMSFYRKIDELVTKRELNYIDAISYYCERNEIDIEIAAAIIKNNHRIVSILQTEGENLNFLPRTARLPI